MKLIGIIRMTMIIYATCYISLCAATIMMGKKLQVIAHEIKPFSLSIYLWVALGGIAILGFERSIKTLANISQRLFLQRHLRIDHVCKYEAFFK